MNLVPFFSWFSESWVGDMVRGSSWLFPALEAVHIVALTMLFGAIAFIDFQILGIIRRDTPVSRVSAQLQPWLFFSLIVILTTGVALFCSEALKLMINTPFKL